MDSFLSKGIYYDKVVSWPTPFFFSARVRSSWLKGNRWLSETPSQIPVSLPGTIPTPSSPDRPPWAQCELAYRDHKCSSTAPAPLLPSPEYNSTLTATSTKELGQLTCLEFRPAVHMALTLLPLIISGS